MNISSFLFFFPRRLSLLPSLIPSLPGREGPSAGPIAPFA